MKQTGINFLKHLGLFLFIEIVFVFVIFREFPSLSLLTETGLLHLGYRILLIVAGIRRTRYADRVWKRFLATYLPLIYHVIIHIWVGIDSVHSMEQASEHAYSPFRLIVGTLGAGILIALGEFRLHRMDHCNTHHIRAHQHCHDEECVQPH